MYKANSGTQIGKINDMNATQKEELGRRHNHGAERMSEYLAAKVSEYESEVNAK